MHHRSNLVWGSPVLCVIAAACGGGKESRATGPVTPATVTVSAGDNQEALPGTAVAISPAVLVAGAGGTPASSVEVTFTVVSGGGSITGATVQTDGQGIARVGSWTLGAGTGQNTLQAEVVGLTPATFTASSVTTLYRIVTRFLVGAPYGGQAPTATQAQAFSLAATKWSSIVKGDLTDIRFTNSSTDPCGLPHPSLNETVDDLLIFAVLEPIDGPGGILGAAGPCFLRNSNTANPFLAATGTMRFDTADLVNLEANGTLVAVITHEMGHILGIGTLWGSGTQFFGLVVNPSVDVCDPNTNPGCVDTYYQGAFARTEFDAVGGTAYLLGNKVPVDNNGQPGTGDSHWRESTFGNELMTGFIATGANPLSRVTAASLRDMGFPNVDLTQADAYVLANPGAVRSPDAPTLMPLQESVYHGPFPVVGSDGRETGTILP